MINITIKWTNRFSPNNQNIKKRERKTAWPTAFPELLKLSGKERKLNPKASITYKRPQTISQHLTKYKSIAHTSNPSHEGLSKPCGRCSLCGNHGHSINMVNVTKVIKSIKGRPFHITKVLTCADWGIYAATCVICKEMYVGQTSTSFSKRWCQHRSVWKSGSNDRDDTAALRLHYDEEHNNDKYIPITSAFTVTFLYQPTSTRQLDFAESALINRLDAKININRTVLPKFM